MRKGLEICQIIYEYSYRRIIKGAYLLLPPLGQLHSRFPQFQLLNDGLSGDTVVEMFDDYGEGNIEDQGRARS
jgi:hypothetical protein